jgi:galactose mutarotase-like enzyme
VLRKPAEAAFRRFETYEIVDPGKWTTKTGADRIDFTHELSDGAGYAYVYRKTLRLEGDTLVIEHELKNTGTKRIDTDVYNHNFFTLDRRTTGPDIVVRFPFEPRARRPLKLLGLKGREIAPLREFTPGESDFTELEGFGTAASDYGFEAEHRATGAGVRVTGTRPLTKYIFWASVKTICPEGYIDVSVDPGKASTWTMTYAFYDAKAR